jgi:acyl-CoA dehydrogenase
MLGGPNAVRILNNAGDYLNAIGHVAVGWQLLAVASTVTKALGSANESIPRDFARGKLAACAYFAEQELPLVPLWLARVEAGGDAVSEMQVAWY